jgi:deazaflavin-dependent oxidoreductase (nitroreductase family)
MPEVILASLASVLYMYLTTTGRVSGMPRTVELWFVVYAGKLYSVNGTPEKTNWVRNIRRNPAVRCRIENTEWEGTGRVLATDEQPLWDIVCRMSCEKYGEPEPWGTPVEITLQDG